MVVMMKKAMAMSDYLICYDIGCPSRLLRIHRALKGQAMALQYSVFLFSGTPEQLDRCLAQLERLMDKQHDDIRAYPLPERGLRWCRGKPLLPDGIYWSGLPLAWQNTPLDSEKSDKMPPHRSGKTVANHHRQGHL